MTLAERLFAPTNARALGVIRAGMGIAALMELAASAPRMLALAEPEAIRTPILEPVASLFAAFAPLVIALWLVSALAFTIGWRTPVAGWLLTAVVVGLVTSDQQLYSNHSYLIAISTGMLTAAGAGRSFSLDARRLGTDAEAAPAWTVLALRAQLSIVYGFAVIAKLNPSFLSGSVVSASLRREGIGFPVEWITFEWMFVLSLFVILSEAFLAVAPWSRRWRPLAFVVGLVLHTGIVAVMYAAWDLAVFSVATLSLYVAFVDAPRQGLAVVWDDACGFCGAWVRWFRRLDWLDTLRFVPRSALAASGVPVGAAEAAEALHLVEPRRTTRAFAAVRAILRRLPVSFLWAPLLAVPPIPAIGERVYRRVAARRTCPILPDAAQSVASGDQSLAGRRST